jgi:manganese transport protein
LNTPSLKSKRIGIFIAAAFIGPGTVTTCAMAGVDFGIEILWALTLSIFITYYFQEIAARMGWVLKADLDQIIKTHIRHRFWRIAILGLILAAILFGNSVYQGGNLSGTLLGLQSLTSIEHSKFLMLLVIAAIVITFLWNERFEAIKRFLMLMVIVMGLAFTLTAVSLGPEALTVLKAAVLPSLNADNTFMVIALVGTTVVPYNLFLHTALVNRSHREIRSIKALRSDTAISIVLGGLISMAILITAASVQSGSIPSVLDLIALLEPTFGSASRFIIGFGLFAAGLTSSITAPLAVGLVAKSIVRSTPYEHPNSSRIASVTVFVIGFSIALIGTAPVEVIKFAQIANGLLLPIIALTLLVLSSRVSVMGEHVNTTTQKLIGIVLVLFTLLLGGMALFKSLS